MLDTSYQQQCFQSHTATDPATQRATHSVFGSTQTVYYQECIEGAVDHGAVETGPDGHVNAIV